MDTIKKLNFRIALQRVIALITLIEVPKNIFEHSVSELELSLFYTNDRQVYMHF